MKNNTPTFGQTTVESEVIARVLGEDLPHLSLSGLAAIISRNWRAQAKDGKIYFGAIPYLEAMGCLNSISDKYGCDPATEIINYFLANAQSWRGPVAKAVKAELNRRVKAEGR